MYTTDTAPAYILRAYEKYIDEQDKLKQKPLSFKKWQIQEPQAENKQIKPPKGKTIADLQKTELIAIFEGLLEHFDNDITSGIEDGTYEEMSNIGNLARIKEAEDSIKWFKAYKPYVCVTISDDNAHAGVHASEKMDIDVYDSYFDKHATAEEHYQWTEEQWDEMIKEKTAAQEIKDIY